MKLRNILIPIILLALIIVFVIVNIFIIKRDTEILNSMLVDIKGAVENGDYGTAEVKIEEFNRELEGKKRYFEAIINHSEIDNIIISGEKLKSYCNEETKEHFFAECSVLEKLFQHIYTNEIPTLSNIL